MSFAGEMKDFLTAYKTVQTVKQGKERNAILRDRNEAWEAMQGRSLDLAEGKERDRKADDTDFETRRQAALTRQRGGPVAAPTGPGASVNGLEAARRAIAKVESDGSGGYAAIGPRTKRGDRAYGKYQVMGANIPQWTKQALGKSMTPAQFRANPEAQEKVFDHIYGGYLKKYGNLKDASAMWFSGKPFAGNTRSDGYNTVPQYVEKVMRAAGGPATGLGRPQPARRTSALPTVTPPPQMPEDGAPREDDDFPEEVGSYAEGGLVDDTFEEGGAAPGPYFARDQEITKRTALPAPAQAASAPEGQAPQGQPPAAPQSGGLTSAIADGLKYIQSALGMSQGAIQGPDNNGARRLAAGEGSFTPQEYGEIRKTVDPGGEMDDAMANIRALEEVHTHYLNKGDHRRAAAAAASLIQFTAKQSQFIANMALKENDPVKRAQLVAKAYGFVPDGNTVEVQARPDGTGMFIQKDAKTGKVISEGPYTPQQLAAAAMGLQNGTVFWDMMTSAAGGPAKPGAAQQRPPSVAERQYQAQEAYQRQRLAGQQGQPTTSPGDEWEGEPAPNAKPTSFEDYLRQDPERAASYARMSPQAQRNARQEFEGPKQAPAKASAGPKALTVNEQRSVDTTIGETVDRLTSAGKDIPPEAGEEARDLAYRIYEANRGGGRAVLPRTAAETAFNLATGKVKILKGGPSKDNPDMHEVILSNGRRFKLGREDLDQLVRKSAERAKQKAKVDLGGGFILPIVEGVGRALAPLPGEMQQRTNERRARGDIHKSEREKRRETRGALPRPEVYE